VTHYPIVVAAGHREPPSHGLRDLDPLLAIARAGGIGLWLHGHRHDAYHHPRTDLAPFPVICAGSATQAGRWSYRDYTLTGHRLLARRRVFDEEAERFRDAEAFELDLPG
jgi:hypothetical protein